MKENLLPEQKEIAKKTAIAMYLEKFLRAMDSTIKTVRYHQKIDTFCFKDSTGHVFHLVSLSDFVQHINHAVGRESSV